MYKILIGFLVICHSFAEMTIDITQGQMAPTPIAVTPLYGATTTSVEVGRKISAVITANLERSGLFKPVDEKAFVQTMASLEKGPKFSEWRLINTHILMQGRVTEDKGHIRVEFKLFDIATEKQMEGWALKGTLDEWRRMAHKISDVIYKRVTGESGYFDTKIVYVSKVGPKGRAVSRLVIMDQDGFNPLYLTSGQSLVTSPRFSPNLHQITYLDFVNNKPRVWLMNTNTQKKELVGNFPGMTFAPRFSPNGKEMVMSLAKDGQTSLYSITLASKEVKRLTREPVIDTSPSYSPDGTKICFNSDRAGRTQIYIMDKEGGSPTRISYGQGSYRSPIWSPRGDLIAFVKITGGTFYLGVMRADGSGERLLTQGWIIDDVCWAPNGRVLMFTRGDKKHTKSYTIDLTGYNERQVPTATDSMSSSWSPLIP